MKHRQITPAQTASLHDQRGHGSGAPWIQADNGCRLPRHDRIRRQPPRSSPRTNAGSLVGRQFNRSDPGGGIKLLVDSHFNLPRDERGGVSGLTGWRGSFTRHFASSTGANHSRSHRNHNGQTRRAVAVESTVTYPRHAPQTPTKINGTWTTTHIHYPALHRTQNHATADRRMSDKECEP